MRQSDFDIFLAEIIQKITGTLSSKSDDYSYDSDKLFNFKLQGRIDGIAPIEALRGNQLKHRASICQGLDELEQGKIRSWEWYLEKYIDNINYDILSLALIKEQIEKIEADENNKQYREGKMR